MIRSLFLALLAAWSTPADASETPTIPTVEAPAADLAEILYHEIGLEGTLRSEVFLAGFRSVETHGLVGGTLAIADMSQPSSAERLYIIDLESKELVFRTFVAHGSGSGGLMAERFSNIEGSHQTSLGLYRVGKEIVSPKHGPALLLDGLDPGVNDEARAREIIVHGADYVSEAFIAQTGRLGRSWGCPAVPPDEMTRVMELLADDGLLYVYGE